MQYQDSTRVAVVAGSTRDIGTAIIKRLLMDDWRVAVLGSDAEAHELLLDDLVLFADDALHTFTADLSSEDSVRAAIAHVTMRFGRIDALITNTMDAPPITSPVDELALELWERVLRTYLTGAFLMAKFAAPHLRETRGAILHVAPTRQADGHPNPEAVLASSGGLVSLTHALAKSLAPDVRVNAISPERVLVPEDVAALVHLLVGDHGRSLTGQRIVLDAPA